MIKLENISKKYIISHEKEALIRNILPNFLRINNYQEFWALRDINLELNSSKSLGVIGRNGSGKTTLLNIISRITSPTAGQVVVKGKVSTLITLGAGFNPDLTGKENIYLNGTILGMTMNRLRDKFKDIVDFSELGNFIDAPLRTYSSGMQMRLGFSVAINADFDILLIDEIFSVGDISFQKKCLDKMKDIRSQGRTIILVSHSVDLIKDFCDEAILIEGGRIISQGFSDDLISKYQEMMKVENKDKDVKPCYRNNAEDAIYDEAPVRVSMPALANSFKSIRPTTIINLNGSKGTKTGTGEAQIAKVRFLDSKGIEKSVFETGEKMQIAVDYVVRKEILNPHFGVAIFRENGVYCFGPNTKFDGHKIDKLKVGKGQFSIEYKNLNLLPGKYLVSVSIWEQDEKFAYDDHYACYNFEVISNKKDHGVSFLEHKWKINLPR